MATIMDRFRRGWNAFKNEPEYRVPDDGISTYYKPDRVTLTRGNDRTIINAIYERIAIDTASIQIKHVRLDEESRFKEVVDDPLNSIFNLSNTLR